MSSTTTARHLLSTADAARRLGRTPATLRNWRWRGEGPAYVRFGNRVHYTEDALAEWISEHEVRPGDGS